MSFVKPVAIGKSLGTRWCGVLLKSQVNDFLIPCFQVIASRIGARPCKMLQNRVTR
jgi:hypothetical protein